MYHSGTAVPPSWFYSWTGDVGETVRGCSGHGSRVSVLCTQVNDQLKVKSPIKRQRSLNGIYRMPI